jgi:RNA polymerase sigma factor (sigma-70 family)
MKGFARSVPQMLAGQRAAGAGDELLPHVPDRRPDAAADRFFDREEVRQLLGRLTDRERTVMLAHYGLDGDGPAGTYEQVGQRLGLSRQQVRQIEQTALVKLRQAAGVMMV